jgi:hypothetical protein
VFPDFVLGAEGAHFDVDESGEFTGKVIDVDAGAAVDVGRVFVGEEQGFHFWGGWEGWSLLELELELEPLNVPPLPPARILQGIKSPGAARRLPEEFKFMFKFK